MQDEGVLEMDAEDGSTVTEELRHRTVHLNMVQMVHFM